MRLSLRYFLCVLVSFCIVFSNSFCALANTTTEQIYAVNTRSIPSYHTVTFSPSVFDKNSNSYSSFGSFSAVDNGAASSVFTSDINNSAISNYQYGFVVDYDYPQGYTVIYNDETINIDLSGVALWMNKIPKSGQWAAPLCLSPYAVPSQAYVIYEGEYEFQIFDGSVGYERFIYERPFTIAKSCNISTSNFGSYEYSLTGSFNSTIPNGFDLSLSAPMLTKADLMGDEIISNSIADYNSYLSFNYSDYDVVSQEDIVTDFMRFSVFDVKFVVFYDFNDSNFVYYYDSSSDDFLLSNPTYDGLHLNAKVFGSPYNSNVVDVNVYSNPSTDSSFLSLFRVLSTGFTDNLRSLGSGMSNIVTNATDNANRIIQNTTQKVDEVKQGVTEVKDSVVETKNSILDLPNKIKEMLIGLIVPPEEDINNKFADFEILLSERFGLIYQSADIIHDFADSFNTSAVTVVSDGFNANTVNFPQVTVSLAGSEFVFGGYDVQLIPEGFEFLQSAVKTAISLVCTILFINMCKNKLEAILK